MSIELQELDCNCSDCKYLSRKLSERQIHVDLHYREQKKSFDTKRIKMFLAGEKRLDKNENDKAKAIFKEARKLTFVFDESKCSLHFGRCGKFNKDVSFITNTLQIETQDCFVHRKSVNN
jgi:hypothetical protein